MARTIAEIYDEIVTVKNGTTELDGLLPLNESSQDYIAANASGSKVAIWRLWCWIFASVCWLQEVLMDKHKIEIDYAISHTPFGTLQWYYKIVLAFQLGYDLLWDDARDQYVYTDTTSATAVESRIVKRAAVTVGNGQLQFKVAKLDNGVPVPLDDSTADESERTTLTAYLTHMAYPGTNIVLISEAADELRLDAVIYFDPLVLNPDGSSVVDNSVYPVSVAVNAFVQQLPFNGRMNRQKLIDAVQAVDGVEDIVMNAVERRYGSLDYEATGREYVPFAGHMVLDLGSSNLTFTPYV